MKVPWPHPSSDEEEQPPGYTWEVFSTNVDFQTTKCQTQLVICMCVYVHICDTLYVYMIHTEYVYSLYIYILIVYIDNWYIVIYDTEQTWPSPSLNSNDTHKSTAIINKWITCIIHATVRSSISHNNQKIRRIQMCVHGRWMRKMWYIHTMEYYSVVKRNGVLRACHTTNASWKQESERRQTRKATYCITPFIRNVWNGKIDRYWKLLSVCQGLGSWGEGGSNFRQACGISLRDRNVPSLQSGNGCPATPFSLVWLKEHQYKRVMLPTSVFGPRD